MWLSHLSFCLSYTIFILKTKFSVQDLDYADDISLMADSVEAGQTFLIT